MADTKLSALTELAATPADTDEVYIRDVSEAAANESKRITVGNLMASASSISFTELAGDEWKVVTGADGWEDWDLSGIIGAGSLTALISVYNNDASDERAGARKNGSALDRSFGPRGITETTLEIDGLAVMLVEVDANRVIEIYGGSVEIRFGVKGYWS